MRRIWFSRQVTDERRRSSKDPPAGSLTENPEIFHPRSGFLLPELTLLTGSHFP
jgi:hypothetical protein